MSYTLVHCDTPWRTRILFNERLAGKNVTTHLPQYKNDNNNNIAEALAVAPELLPAKLTIACGFRGQITRRIMPGMRSGLIRLPPASRLQ